MIFETDGRTPTPLALDFVRRSGFAASPEAGEAVWSPLSGDGSDRRFARVRAGNQTAVLVYGPDPAENRSYDQIGRHLYQVGAFGPRFLASDPVQGWFLIEDLGDVRLQDLVQNTDDILIQGLYDPVIQLLADFHEQAIHGFDAAWCHQTPRYDRRVILKREAGYFLEAFAQGTLGLNPDPAELAVEFEALATEALAGTQTVLMHRDFQSRNLMVQSGRPRVVDFQGARPGPPGYDLASLLYDPYVRLAPGFRDELKSMYIQRRRGQRGFDPRVFEQTYPRLAVCRLLQALGAYGHLTRVRGKIWFKTYISPALGDLARLLSGPGWSSFPRLKDLAALAAERWEVMK
jgi:hypothetical protein